jgi:hypothetical protein
MQVRVQTAGAAATEVNPTTVTHAALCLATTLRVLAVAGVEVEAGVTAQESAAAAGAFLLTVIVERVLSMDMHQLGGAAGNALAAAAAATAIGSAVAARATVSAQGAAAAATASNAQGAAASTTTGAVAVCNAQGAAVAAAAIAALYHAQTATAAAVV